MAEEKVTEGIETTVQEEPARDYFEGRVLHLAKPFKFEGQSYETIDFSRLDELTGGDHMNAMNMASRMNQSNGVLQPPAPQLDTNYHYALASFATGLPVEAFAAMPYRAAFLVSGYIKNFTLGRG